MERISIEGAAAALLARLSPLPGRERVPLSALPGRVLAEDVFARLDVPPFDRSPLDGYALRSADLAGAGPGAPALLRVAGTVYAGGTFPGAVGPGEAVRIMTGAPIPAGADCVVRQEDTDGGREQVQVYSSLHAGQNLCLRGEDVTAGALLFRRGERMDWTHIPALAGQGVTEVAVFPLPRAAVLSTGDELVSPGAALGPGQIYDSNGPMLAARLAALHARPLLLPGGADDPGALARRLAGALEKCDLAVTTGGVSVGEHDYLLRAAELLGAEILFHGVAAKPGTPALAFLAGGKPVVALSGNPFAAAAMFEVLARPALERLAGAAHPLPRRLGAVLRGEIGKPSPVRRLVRARLEGGEVHVAPQGHSSGMALGLAGCNCLIDLPAGTPALSGGAAVEVILL